MSRYEEMRKERLEEHKKKEPVEAGGDEVHRSTTIFHGNAGGEHAGKFVDAPSYLR